MSTSVDPLSTAWPVSAAASAAASVSSQTANSGISMGDFLKILSAELQYQDPMGSDSSDGSHSDYITQMVQYNLLSQVGALARQVTLSAASAAIGRSVLYAREDADGKVEQVSGTVSAVDLSTDSPSYLVDDTWVDQSGIIGFYRPAADTADPSGT